MCRSWPLSGDLITVLFKDPALGLCYGLNNDYSEALGGEFVIPFELLHNFSRTGVILFVI